MVSKKEINTKIDFEAISHWISTGFFFDDKYFLKEYDFPRNRKYPNIKWFYNPSNRSYAQTIDQFSKILEKIISKISDRYKIILPISGGLDSRTIACALKGKKNIISYSYEFEDGINETSYAKNIADACGFEFHSFKIPRGYLWNEIDELSSITKCRTEFTHSRQMAVIKEISSFGDVIISGSMGDLLFDSSNIPSNCTQKTIIDNLLAHITKPAGRELAEELWTLWKINGSQNRAIREIIKNKLDKILISNPASTLRAFKVENYVQNWTNVNMDVFKRYKKVISPYHEDIMCDFVCTVPERFLNNRQIQIDYIKNSSPELALIPWQKYDLNLYNYQNFNTIYFPRRIMRYTNRLIKEKVLQNEPKVERNWELQFFGENNKRNLENWLFNNPMLTEIIPSSLIDKFYDKFRNVDSIKYSHAISMFLTLSVWCKKFWKTS